MELDLYTFGSFMVGVLVGCLGGIWLAGLISSHKVERLEQKVNVLSDNKFKMTGERVSLKQLEERLDAEAASIPMAETELKEKSGEIRELTAALNETTALTSELAEALRIRKAKVQQLQVEQGKWIKRNKALLIKTGQAESKINALTKEIAGQQHANTRLENGTDLDSSGSASALSEKTTAAPALAASHHVPAEGAGSEVSVDRLKSRLAEMESELQNWADRVDKLEARATGKPVEASSLALLEQALRGEAEKEGAVGSDAKPQLLGGHSAT